MRPAASLAAVVAAVLLLAACGRATPEAPPADPAAGAARGSAGSASTPQGPVYVAVGASETVGRGADEPLADAWPQLLFRTELPREAVFVNLGVPGSTVAEALDAQAPEATKLKPALVTVWLNVNDLLRGVSPADYERQLGTLVRQLRRGGATKVLVANTPPLDRLPAYRACLQGQLGDRCRLRGSDRPPSPEELNALVAAYNGAIRNVSTREGATLVDLHATGMAARDAGTEATLVSRDGFHPSTAGHQAVASAFTAALRGAGGL